MDLGGAGARAGRYHLGWLVTNVVGDLGVLELSEGLFGVVELLLGVLRLGVELQIEADDLGVCVTELALPEQHDGEAGLGELLSHPFDLGVALLEPGDEVCDGLWGALAAGAVEESVEDFDHVGVCVEGVFRLQPLDDLVDSLLVVQQLVPERLGELSAEARVLVEGVGEDQVSEEVLWGPCGFHDGCPPL